MNTKKRRVALGVSAAGAAGILVIGLTSLPVEATPNTADSKILVQTTIKPTTLWSHGRTAAGDRCACCVYLPNRLRSGLHHL